MLRPRLDKASLLPPLLCALSAPLVLACSSDPKTVSLDIVTGHETDAMTQDPKVTRVKVEGISPEMKVSCEEVFGPVVGLASYASVVEAIDLANSSPFGLQAGIFTARTDAAVARYEDAASRLDTGASDSQVAANLRAVESAVDNLGAMRRSFDQPDVEPYSVGLSYATIITPLVKTNAVLSGEADDRDLLRGLDAASRPERSEAPREGRARPAPPGDPRQARPADGGATRTAGTSVIAPVTPPPDPVPADAPRTPRP